jgi:hypothetical protein
MRAPAAVPTPPPPGQPLVLQSAEPELLASPPLMLLGFDRAVDISAFDGTAIVVFDGSETEQYYQGVSASLVDEVTVQVVMASQGSDTDYGLYMNASADSGIVAVDDAGTWPGVDGLVLPYSG